MRVFVSGASGNVGKTIVRAMANNDKFELAGGWCLEEGSDLGLMAGCGENGVLAYSDLAKGLEETKPDIVIDFSATPLLCGNMDTYLKYGLNVVIGTTGLTDEQFAPYMAAVAEKGLRWAAISNYSLGVSLIKDFVEKVRKYYPYVSIIDRHTQNMANAPSGTAVTLAQAAKGESGPIKSKESYKGVLAGDVGGVQVISQRMPWPGPYSGHDIMLARQDEIIKISIEDFTSEVYIDGIFMTAAKLPTMAEGTFIRDLSEIR